MPRNSGVGIIDVTLIVAVIRPSAGYPKMKRREFIGIAAVGAAGVVVPMPVRGQSSAAATLAHPRLLAIVRDEHVVAELGRRYRALVPNENAEVVLMRMIQDDLHGVHSELTRDIAAQSFQARVDRLVQADFDHGRTMMLQGWILSQTEARQCALFSLLQT